MQRVLLLMTNMLFAQRLFAYLHAMQVEAALPPFIDTGDDLPSVVHSSALHAFCLKATRLTRLSDNELTRVDCELLLCCRHLRQ